MKLNDKLNQSTNKIKRHTQDIWDVRMCEWFVRVHVCGPFATILRPASTSFVVDPTPWHVPAIQMWESNQIKHQIKIMPSFIFNEL